MKQLMAITKALSDRTRMRVLGALGEGELCACQLSALLELAPSTIARHLTLLRQAGLVHSRRRGRWAFYRLCGEEAAAPALSALEFVRDSLAGDAIAQADKRRLVRIREIELEVLCAETGTPRAPGAPGAPARGTGRSARIEADG